MQLKHSIVAAAVVTAALPVGILAVGAGASLARSAVGPTAEVAMAPTVAVRKTHLGKILVAGKNRFTLYLNANDSKNHSNCTGACAQTWPPLTVSSSLKAGHGVKASKLGKIKRGRVHQVTYAGHPLYFFTNDTKAGQTTGQGAGGFYVVSPSGKAIK